MRLKLQDCMTVAVFKSLYQFLGINFERPEYVHTFHSCSPLISHAHYRHSTVFNSTAYKALALRFDLWSRAPTEVLQLYFEHFRQLLTVSRFKRFNTLHCLKKANLVRRILHAMKANTFDSSINPEIFGQFTGDDAKQNDADLRLKSAQRRSVRSYSTIGTSKSRKYIQTHSMGIRF